MTLTIPERVAQGAAWLDEHYPGWERHIDLTRLDLSDPCRCVLGQLALAITDQEIVDDFFIQDSSPYSWLVLQQDALPRDKCWSDRGFLTYTGPEDWPLLDEAWISLIKLRFDTGALSDATR